LYKKIENIEDKEKLLKVLDKIKDFIDYDLLSKKDYLSEKDFF
jgi:hypothetical protein